MKKVLCILLLLNGIVVQAQKLELVNWEIKNSSEINVPDQQVSLPVFQISNWYKATVPTTVLIT